MASRHSTATAEPTPMTTEIVIITPEIACDWLALNTHNRPLREAWVQELARRIENDEWVLNGESIKFNHRGILVDGQYRLSAIAMANKPIESLVTRGVPENAFETLDGGKRRNLSDALSLVGETSAMALAGTINLHWRYEHRQMVGAVVLPTTAAALAHFESHPDLRIAAKVGEKYHGKARTGAAVIGTAWYLFHEKDQEAADLFMHTLAEGAELARTDPIFRLRERFITNRESRLRLGSAEMLALTIKAWNYWRVGREMTALAWRFRGGEIFPEPQ